MDRFINPTTAWEQGAVVVNAKRDNDSIYERLNIGSDIATHRAIVQPYGSAAGLHDDVFSIISGEPVLMQKESFDRGVIRDTDFVGLSALNGIFKLSDGNNNSIEEKRKARIVLRDSLTFAGFARNDAWFDTKDTTRENTGFAILIGGIKTTFNTSNEDIVQGQFIVWDLPEVTEEGRAQGREPIEGIEDGKILPVLKPLKSCIHSSVDEVLDSMFEQKGKTNKTPCDVVASSLLKFAKFMFDLGWKNRTTDQEDANMDSFVQAFLDQIESVEDAQTVTSDLIASIANAYRDINNRIVGKAINSARPGDPFDILIGTYSV